MSYISIKESMDKYFFYNHNEVAAFIKEREAKLTDLYKKYFAAKEEGKLTLARRVVRSISKFKAENEKFKGWAEDAGYCDWH